MTDAHTPASSSNSLLRWCLHNPVELAASLVCGMVIIVVFLQVLFRYALHMTLDCAEELAMAGPPPRVGPPRPRGGA